MSDITIKWQSGTELVHDQLVNLLKTFGDLLPNPLSARVDLHIYANKLLTYADIACAFDGADIVGFLALYANDRKTLRANLPILAILPSARGLGLGKKMVAHAINLARKRGMKSIDLGVLSTNDVAQRLYRSCGFVADMTQGERWIMRCELE